MTQILGTYPQSGYGQVDEHDASSRTLKGLNQLNSTLIQGLRHVVALVRLGFRFQLKYQHAQKVIIFWAIGGGRKESMPLMFHEKMRTELKPAPALGAAFRRFKGGLRCREVS